MRMNITLIVLSLMLLTVGIVCVCGMHGNLEALTTEAVFAVNSLPENMTAASAALDRFGARWAKLEGRWQLFAIHEDLDSIASALMEAETALENGDVQAAKIACEQLYLTLRTIHRKEVPSIGNIF